MLLGGRMINDGVTRHPYNYSRNTRSSTNIIYRDDSSIHNCKINTEGHHGITEVETSRNKETKNERKDD